MTKPNRHLQITVTANEFQQSEDDHPLCNKTIPKITKSEMTVNHAKLRLSSVGKLYNSGSKHHDQNINCCKRRSDVLSFEDEG